MSFVLLGILNSQASGAAQAYFLSVLGGAGNDGIFDSSVGLDSVNNIYVFGTTASAGAGSNDALLAKYDSSAEVPWQRTLGGASSDEGNSVAVDSLDNIYLVGRTLSDVPEFSSLLLAKYNSSGNIQFQKILSGFLTEAGRSVAIDSADNVYAFGNTRIEATGANDFLLAKYDSSGSIQWQRTLGGSDSEFGFSVAIDSSDNIYFLGFSRSTSANDDFVFAKYNSSGTIQWQRVLGGASNDEGRSVAIDSSDNLYVFGRTASTGAGGNDLLLAKYDSSGTIQWQRVLGGAGNDQGFSVAIDSADNVYVLGNTDSTGAGGNDLLLAKYDSSGTIQFQRVLGGAGNDEGNSVAIDSSGNVYVLGRTASTGAGGDDFLLAKLPNDGSLEGTYLLDGNNIIYQASTLTAATSTLTDASASLTASTSTLTAATASLTSASASLTVVTEEIG